LEGEFTARDAAPSGSFQLTVAEADIARTVIALRVVTPASIRDEVAMLPVIYGMGWSFGKIQAVLVEAGRRAAELTAAQDLSGIECVALDEMFSQGNPVFAGIDLDTQYLFELEVHETRTAEAWAESLGRLRDRQGLRPKIVVKDAGTGLAKGVGEAFPGIQEIDDLFHAKQAMGKVAQRLERSAYAGIAYVEALEVQWAKHMDGPSSLRRSLGQQLTHARKQEAKASTATTDLTHCDEGAVRYQPSGISQARFRKDLLVKFYRSCGLRQSMGRVFSGIHEKSAC
jgi:hypothetical protein